MECEVAAEGKIAVPGKKFFEIVRSLPDDMVEVDVEGEKIAVKCRKSRFKMSGKAADEFPKLPEQKALGSFAMETAAINDMIRRRSTRCRQISRARRCAASLGPQEGYFTMVATDGHRLSRVIRTGFSDVERKDVIVSEVPEHSQSLLEDKGKSKSPWPTTTSRSTSRTT
jgi:DNA polymerase-3 subunit beta